MPRARLPARSALLLIDVVNPFDFPDAARLLRRALPAAPRIRALKRRAARARIPAIYVNDNYGDWHANFAQLVERCVGKGARGRRFVTAVAPDPDDYYVLKPLHSGFHSTSLDVLLQKLDVEAVVLVGVAAHICVFFTAMDAYMRGLEVIVLRDCVVSADTAQKRGAIRQMEDALKARVVLSRAVDFAPAPRRPREPRRRSRVPGSAPDQVHPRRT